jgi:hypothetical protein
MEEGIFWYMVIWHRPRRFKVTSSSVKKLKRKLKDAFIGVEDAV